MPAPLLPCNDYAPSLYAAARRSVGSRVGVCHGYMGTVCKLLALCENRPSVVKLTTSASRYRVEHSHHNHFLLSHAVKPVPSEQSAMLETNQTYLPFMPLAILQVVDFSSPCRNYSIASNKVFLSHSAEIAHGQRTIFNNRYQWSPCTVTVSFAPTRTTETYLIRRKR